MVAEKHGVTVRQAETDLRTAYRLIADMSDEKREDHRGRIGTFLWRQARKAEEREDGATAVAAMRELSKLFGLYAPTELKAEITARRVIAVPPSSMDELAWSAWSSGPKELSAK